MSARLLATFCLVWWFVSVCPAQSAASQDSELVVYLKIPANQPQAPVMQMKRELTALMHTAGYRVEYRSPDQEPLIVAPFLAVVELHGACALSAGYAGTPAPPINGESLATTVVTDGQVLPFSAVNCAALARSLAPAIARDAAAQRDYYFGRAMARVVAHELYHVLMQTTDHGRSGLARSCFSTADLMSERFEFEDAVLARLRRRPDPGLTAAGSDDATDR